MSAYLTLKSSIYNERGHDMQKLYIYIDAQILSNHRVINLQGKKNAKCMAVENYIFATFFAILSEI